MKDIPPSAKMTGKEMCTEVPAAIAAGIIALVMIAVLLLSKAIAILVVQPVRYAGSFLRESVNLLRKDTHTHA